MGSTQLPHIAIDLKQFSPQLPDLNLPADFIMDTAHIVTNLSSQQTTSVDMLYGIKLPLPDQQWLWQMAPQGELAKQVKLHTSVAAYTHFTHNIT